jgi:hypothetical protein
MVVTRRQRRHTEPGLQAFWRLFRGVAAPVGPAAPRFAPLVKFVEIKKTLSLTAY